MLLHISRWLKITSESYPVAVSRSPYILLHTSLCVPVLYFILPALPLPSVQLVLFLSIPIIFTSNPPSSSFLYTTPSHPCMFFFSNSLLLRCLSRSKLLDNIPSQCSAWPASQPSTPHPSCWNVTSIISSYNLSKICCVCLKKASISGACQWVSIIVFTSYLVLNCAGCLTQIKSGCCTSYMKGWQLFVRNTYPCYHPSSQSCILFISLLIIFFLLPFHPICLCPCALSFSIPLDLACQSFTSFSSSTNFSLLNLQWELFFIQLSMTDGKSVYGSCHCLWSGCQFWYMWSKVMLHHRNSKYT